MSTLFWVITWILSGTLTSLVILPYCIRVTNKIKDLNDGTLNGIEFTIEPVEIIEV